MRIGIDATALYGRYGGVEYALWNLLFAFNAQENSHQFVVYIPHDGPPPELLKEFSSRWRWVHLPFRGEQKMRRIAWQQLSLPAQLRADGCEVFHAPTYVAPILQGVLRPRIPTILTVYDVIALDSPQFATPLNRLHYRVVMPRAIRTATRIIAPAEEVRAAMARHVPSAANRTTVVPLGLEPIFREEPSTLQLEAVRARYDLPGEFLLFVGNFEPKKNLVNLLRALETLPDAPPLVIAGGARAWGEKLGVGKGYLPKNNLVKFIGYVPRRDLPALYAQCRVFAFPSLAEGFGFPVLEALACGAPVVTSCAVPLPELQKVALICDPCDAASIATQIQRALAVEQMTEAQRKARREYSRAFTWQRAAQQTLQIYNEAFAEARK